MKDDFISLPLMFLLGIGFTIASIYEPQKDDKPINMKEKKIESKASPEIKTLQQQLIENRLIPDVEPIELVKEIHTANQSGKRTAIWYKELTMQEQLWLKKNGIVCKKEFDRNDTFFRVSWK
jgi:hypothetical protein